MVPTTRPVAGTRMFVLPLASSRLPKVTPLQSPAVRVTDEHPTRAVTAACLSSSIVAS